MNVAQGLVIDRRGTYQAFVRGRQCANLYRTEFNDELVSQSVGEHRLRLRLNEQPRPASWRDRLAFVKWAAAGVGIYLSAMLLALAPLMFVAVGILLLVRR